MVKLPEPDVQLARAVGERGSSRRTRSHYSWSTRFGRPRNEQPTEPKGLVELDKLAKRTVVLMEKYGPKCVGNYYKAMDLLRLQYNLNFIVLCENCGGPHAVDEILAPER